VCGRFTLTATPAEVAEHFELDDVPAFAPRFNIAPTQQVATIRARAHDGRRELAFCRWGLIPHWAVDPSIGQRMINARAETIAEKPAFRHPFRRRRCLVAADGFYEWAPGPHFKQPWRIARADGSVFGFAGLFDRYDDPERGVIESCTIVTTLANERTAAIHPRMPVILDPAAYALWLDTDVEDPERMLPLLRPYPEDSIALHPVSRHVNDVRNDDASCAAPTNEAPRQGSLL
jgi:putative SOS response-associated peptidase YedK